MGSGEKHVGVSMPGPNTTISIAIFSVPNAWALRVLFKARFSLGALSSLICSAAKPEKANKLS
uniref:Uncharacterized protein n=1 Tax=Candidatus Kentrum sp. LPFa TaxID=2126335 RepID=A0A450WW93_9GAMM|nr:MAG: hypothetical protein BECKLPF1236B_GA0070989_12475 [Candidatus Kentron sp. LPFa]